jgi:hypothetical protein
MKLISKLLGCLIAMLFVGALYAQEDSIKTLPAVTVKSGVNVSDKVMEAFNTDFKDAVSPRWFQINKNFLVKFISEDQKHNTLYKKNGYMIYDIAYGQEKSLPDNIRKLVKSNYVEYNITNAINVKQENRNIWVINLEDAKKLVLVRVEDGALEEVENYDKS